MQRYYYWFNLIFLLLAILLIKNFRTAMMFTIVIGVPLSYLLKPMILGKDKKNDDNVIDMTDEVEITDKKEDKEDKE